MSWKHYVFLVFFLLIVVGGYSFNGVHTGKFSAAKILDFGYQRWWCREQHPYVTHTVKSTGAECVCLILVYHCYQSHVWLGSEHYRQHQYRNLVLTNLLTILKMSGTSHKVVLEVAYVVTLKLISIKRLRFLFMQVPECLSQTSRGGVHKLTSSYAHLWILSAKF